jgi:hypothetical protein
MTVEPTAWVKMEIAFNLFYLAAIWGLVAAMAQRHARLGEEGRRLRAILLAAFGLLALGDTGHVGFRVVALIGGDLQMRMGGMGLVGLGALSTAITVTLFYVLLLLAWTERFHKPLGRFGVLLLLAAVVRFGIMAMPQNAWDLSVPPQPWSLIRNLPLMVLGLAVAFLILRDARAAADRSFIWIGVCILISFAFYTPVILFVQQVPLLGMLMIPKTLAYVAMAGIAYASLFRWRAPGEALVLV